MLQNWNSRNSNKYQPLLLSKFGQWNSYKNKDENWIFEKCKSIRDLKILRPIDAKGWMKRSVLISMQKLNIPDLLAEQVRKCKYWIFVRFSTIRWRNIYKGWWNFTMPFKTRCGRSIEGYRSLLPLKFSGVKCIHNWKNIYLVEKDKGC